MLATAPFKLPAIGVTTVTNTCCMRIQANTVTLMVRVLEAVYANDASVVQLAVLAAPGDVAFFYLFSTDS